MKLFEIKTKERTEIVGGINEDDAKGAFSRIFPHLEINKVGELKKS